jgi:hypothetical protein
MVGSHLEATKFNKHRFRRTLQELAIGDRWYMSVVYTTRIHPWPCSQTIRPASRDRSTMSSRNSLYHWSVHKMAPLRPCTGKYLCFLNQQCKNRSHAAVVPIHLRATRSHGQYSQHCPWRVIGHRAAGSRYLSTMGRHT